jgi:hypothetical protein
MDSFPAQSRALDRGEKLVIFTGPRTQRGSRKSEITLFWVIIYYFGPKMFEISIRALF